MPRGNPFVDYPQGESNLSVEDDLHGRVVWSIDKFLVLVGKWAESIQEELTELLEKAFSLPYFDFVYDEHCDLVHGWSGDMPR